jgi:hypothetical protein
VNKLKKSLSILGAASALALGGAVLSGTPAAPVKPQAAQAAVTFTGCYWALDGTYWCHRNGCTYMDWRLYGCYNGLVKVNRPWYA